jgi:hypothetical protein
MKFGRFFVVSLILAGVLAGCQSASEVSDKDVKSWGAVKDKDGKPLSNTPEPSVQDER